jgi:hypothetical protein
MQHIAEALAVVRRPHALPREPRGSCQACMRFVLGGRTNRARLPRARGTPRARLQWQRSRTTSPWLWNCPAIEEWGGCCRQERRQPRRRRKGQSMAKLRKRNQSRTSIAHQASFSSNAVGFGVVESTHVIENAVMTIEVKHRTSRQYHFPSPNVSHNPSVSTNPSRIPVAKLRTQSRPGQL